MRILKKARKVRFSTNLTHRRQQSRSGGVGSSSSSGDGDREVMQKPQKLRILAPQPPVLTNDPKVNRADQPVSIDVDDLSSVHMPKPYVASPLPIWLQKQIRTNVCSIYGPSKLPMGVTPKQHMTLVGSEPHTLPYSCVICSVPKRETTKVKSHCYLCVKKNGNPHGHNWYRSWAIGKNK